MRSDNIYDFLSISFGTLRREEKYCVLARINFSEFLAFVRKFELRVLYFLRTTCAEEHVVFTLQWWRSWLAKKNEQNLGIARTYWSANYKCGLKQKILHWEQPRLRSIMAPWMRIKSIISIPKISVCVRSWAAELCNDPSHRLDSSGLYFMVCHDNAFLCACHRGSHFWSRVLFQQTWENIFVSSGPGRRMYYR